MWCMWKLKITDFYFKQVMQQAIYEPDMSVITYFLLYLLHKFVLVLVTQVAYCWFIQFCSVLQWSLIWLTQQTWSAICLRTPAVLSQCLRSSKVLSAMFLNPIHFMPASVLTCLSLWCESFPHLLQCDLYIARYIYSTLHINSFYPQCGAADKSLLCSSAKINALEK